MKEIPSAHPAPPIRRECRVGDGHRYLPLMMIALVLCVPALTSARGPESTYPVQADSGWNLLSLPASVTNGDIGILFPSAASAAFTFRDPIGYEEQDTLQSGVGFWLRFDSSETVSITGELIFKDTVEVHAGWNIVGSLSLPIAADSIRTEPPGIMASQFFRFRTGVGYEEADTLYPGYGYWVKVNQVGSIVLSSGSGLRCPGMPTVSYAGKTYNTVLIGTQCWLRENLDVGTMVLGSQEQTDNDTIEKYCYNDSLVNCATYGGLYQWNEAMQYDTTQGVRGICPTGWHMPTLAEFQTLGSTVGNDGNALKRADQGFGAGQGTNTSGFSALLAGYRNYDGGFYNLGSNGYFWSSTQYGAAVAHSLDLYYDDAGVYLSSYGKPYGFSVRCLKGTSNSRPSAPSNPTPPDGSAGQSPSVMLGWSCADPDSDALTYDVYFASRNPPDTMVSSNQARTTFGTSGLSGGTTYYWKVVVRDTHADTTSGPVWSFTTGAIGGSPCPGTPTVTYAGKTYNTVLIGTQCWLRENLNVGTMVLGSANQTNNGTIEKYCYGDNPSNCETHGGLYQWDEAMQYATAQGARGICPPGWHLPTLAETGPLSSTVGGDGNALKAIGQGTGGGAGTNTSGFSALLAGYRNTFGGFVDLGYYGIFWSSTQIDASGAHGWYLSYEVTYIYRLSGYKTGGFNVRCLNDEVPNHPPDAPSNPSPPDSTSGQSPSVMLGWSCADPDSHAVTYDVYFANSNPPDTMVSSNQTGMRFGVSGLAGALTYFWKVVARDEHGDTTTGPVWSFTTGTVGGSPCPGTPTVTYAGKTYNTVQIGGRCWLRENIDLGTMLAGSANQTNNGTIEKYCYGDNPANCAAYGALYEWHEAMQYDTIEGGQGVCPPGWHIPTFAEFQTLSSAVVGDGNALKAIGQGTGGGAGTNTSGFSALLAGYRYYGGSFYALGDYGEFWSSTQNDAASARYLFLSYDHPLIYLNGLSKIYSLSVRCLED